MKTRVVKFPGRLVYEVQKFIEYKPIKHPGALQCVDPPFESYWRTVQCFAILGEAERFAEGLSRNSEPEVVKEFG